MPIFATAFNGKQPAQSKTGAVVQLVRMPACHAGGRGFESLPHRENPLQNVLRGVFSYLGNAGTPFLPPLQQTGHPGTSTPYRDKSELQNYVPPRRFRYASSHRFRTPPHTHVLSRRGANHAVAPKSAVAEPACRQYRVVRWFLLPEAGLRRRPLSPTTFVIVANQKCQLYPGCTPRQASCYGRCFARSVAPDAALRLQYATCRTERTELRMQSSIPPRRLFTAVRV